MKRAAATAAAVVRNIFADSGIAEGDEGDGEGGCSDVGGGGLQQLSVMASAAEAAVTKAVVEMVAVEEVLVVVVAVVFLHMMHVS